MGWMQQEILGQLKGMGRLGGAREDDWLVYSCGVGAETSIRAPAEEEVTHKQRHFPPSLCVVQLCGVCDVVFCFVVLGTGGRGLWFLKVGMVEGICIYNICCGMGWAYLGMGTFPFWKYGLSVIRLNWARRW